MSPFTRHELQPKAAKLIAELGKSGVKGIEMMVQHKWREEPSRATGRNKLIKDKKA